MTAVIILPLIAALVAEALKFILPGNQRPFALKSLFTYAGMPSGHAAIVVSLATTIGLTQGIYSPLFGFAVVFAVLVIRDAVGLRQYLGLHGHTLNILVKDLSDDRVLEQNYPLLLEKIGHTYAQICAGGIVGFVVSIIGYYVWLG